MTPRDISNRFNITGLYFTSYFILKKIAVILTNSHTKNPTN